MNHTTTQAVSVDITPIAARERSSRLCPSSALWRSVTVAWRLFWKP